MPSKDHRSPFMHQTSKKVKKFTSINFEKIEMMVNSDLELNNQITYACSHYAASLFTIKTKIVPNGFWNG